MSTKVFNGYILPNTSLAKLKKMCVSLREMLHDVHIEISHKKFAERCSEMIDQNTFGITFHDNVKRTKTHFIPYIETFTEISKQQLENQDKYHDLNFEFSITFIPSGKNILALTYCNYEDLYLPYWESMPEVSEYRYWNADRPEKISQEEWITRGKKWSKALEDAPVESGFNIMILSNNIVFSTNKIIEYQPDIASRIKTSIELLTVQNKFNELDNKALTAKESIKMYVQIRNDINNGSINTDELYKKIRPDIKKLDENILMERIEINSVLSLIN